MAVLTTIVMSGRLGASVANQENKTEPQSLELLSSIASMVSENLPTERIQKQERQLGLPSARTRPIKSTKTSGQFSRSLSRSFSSRNLMLQESSTSSLSRSVSSRNLLQQVPSADSLSRSVSSRNLKEQASSASSLSRSVSSQNLLQQASANSSSILSHKRRKLQHSAEIVNEHGRLMGSNLSIVPYGSLTLPSSALFKNEENSTKTFRTTKKVSLDQTISSTDATIHCCPSDEILNNVYQAHEMQLPDGIAMGSILRVNTTRKNEAVVDDYNFEIVSNTPLEIPPRFPSASESYAIAEKSREEKSNWGWYAE